MYPDSPAELIRQHFINTHTAVPVSPPPPINKWGVVVNTMPLQGPDNHLAIMDTGAVTYNRIHSTGERPVSETLSIMIRSVDYPTGFKKGRDIEELLDLIGVSYLNGKLWPPVRVGGQDYILLAAHIVVPTTRIGQEEEKRRQLFTINLRLTYTAYMFGI